MFLYKYTMGNQMGCERYIVAPSMEAALKEIAVLFDCTRTICARIELFSTAVSVAR